jgi:hypothetical protein
LAGPLLILRLVLALLLYLFLGVAFYILWRGLSQSEEKPAVTCAPATLIIEEGSDKGKQFALRPVTTVGRASDNPLVIHDPYASASHAMILWREDRWWLEDLESHNGTFLNGEQVSQPLTLTTGDCIRIGETILRFEMASRGVQPPDLPTDRSSDILTRALS